MRVIDEGHNYGVNIYDCDSPNRILYIIFMKRIGDNYPGNTGKPKEGTNCQEILKVLIHRTKYLNKQKPSWWNILILYGLRISLWSFEKRAAKIHKRKLRLKISTVENYCTCRTCGHVWTGDIGDTMISGHFYHLQCIPK